MEIYHERQHLQFCLLHALNNLLQGDDIFTKQSLDAIADSLESTTGAPKSFSFLSPGRRRHRNRFTGNYDANVLMAACASRGLEARWHDRRVPISASDLTHPDLIGVIVNRAERKLLGLWKGRHWITLREILGRWYNLDSDLEEPVAIDNDPVGFLKGMVEEEEAEVFFVVRERKEKKIDEKKCGSF